MSAVLQTAPPTCDFKTIGDLPLQVIAMLVIQFGRIYREFDMFSWAWECPMASPRDGSFKYHIAYNAQQAQVFFQITREHEPTQSQLSWRVMLEDLKANGASAKLEPL